MATEKTITGPQEARNTLENKLTQLNSLLMCCYGVGQEWFEEIGTTHRDNIMWLASDLARDCGRLVEGSSNV